MQIQNQKRGNDQRAMASGFGCDSPAVGGAPQALIEKMERGYERQELPDASVYLAEPIHGERYMTPLVTLKNSLDGVAHIVQNEGDFILIIGSYVGGFYKTHRWFKDAVLALFAHAARIEVVLK